MLHLARCLLGTVSIHFEHGDFCGGESDACRCDVKKGNEHGFLVLHLARDENLLLPRFKFDKRDRLVGRITHPTCFLDYEEFETYVETLAIESDRLEYLLTGRARSRRMRRVEGCSLTKRVGSILSPTYLGGQGVSVVSWVMLNTNVPILG